MRAISVVPILRLACLGLVVLARPAMAAPWAAPETPQAVTPVVVHSLSLALAPAAWGPVVASEDGAVAGGAEPLALATAFTPAPELAVRISGGRTDRNPKKPSGKPQRGRRTSLVALTPERAQALLRSITFPGWGQASLGHPTSGAVFAVAETGIWGTFLAFRVQEHLRKDAAANTARLFAGVDLRGRDEEFLRLVGAFASSDEYNLLVVSRDAANQYYDNPVAYRDYIARHSLSGHDSWSWQDPASFFRYGAQRRNAQRAALRANTSLALAIGNRLLSMLHVARLSGKLRPSAMGSWNFEVVPAGGNDPTAFHYGVRARF